MKFVYRLFMAEKFPNEMKLKLHAKIYHGKLGTSSVSSAAFRRNLEPQGRPLVWRFSAIPADLSKSELQTPTPQGRIVAQKFLHGLCAHFWAF